MSPFLILILSGSALAQGALPAFDPHTWGATPFSLAAVVLFVTASLEGAADRRGLVVRAWAWIACSILLGITGAVVLNLLGYGATLGVWPYPWATILSGTLAGLSASGFRDFAKTVSDWVQRPPAPQKALLHSGPQQIVPLGTPGTEPLHDTAGNIIGAVKPLTPITPAAAPVAGVVLTGEQA